MSRYFDDEGNQIRDSVGSPVNFLTERHEAERVLGRELTDGEWWDATETESYARLTRGTE